MRICMLACAGMVAALAASAEEASPGIKLLPGHPIYHESEQEAGVAMALAITPAHDRAGGLMELCEELRRAAGLGIENGEGLRLEVIFVVPYKEMAIEGYYFPKDGTFEQGTLVPGSGVSRGALDGIVARAGIPPRVLDETNVEQEISCATGEPLWRVVWRDVRPIGGQDPDTVIESAYHRFMAIHRSVLEHRARAA
jgi:hypothetical protein